MIIYGPGRGHKNDNTEALKCFLSGKIFWVLVECTPLNLLAYRSVNINCKIQNVDF